MIDKLMTLGYNKPNDIRIEGDEMFHKGLNKEMLVAAAKKLIEEQGRPAFSMRLLAETMGVKTASLYAHIESMEALFTEVGLSALEDQKKAQMEAIAGKNRNEAVRALAVSYRKFAREHWQLYQMILQMPGGQDEVLQKAAAVIVEPSMQVLKSYRMEEKRRMEWQRVLRGVMHGFVSQEQAGYFSHYPVSLDESYALAVDCVIAGLEKEEENAD